MSTIAIAPRQVASSRVAAASTGVASALSDTADVAWRNLLTQLRTPQALVFATIQPVIFVLLFRYAFDGAIHVPGTNYVDFLMPGIFAQTVAFGAVGTAVGLSGDLRTGILVRFRTLPVARIAVLGGRTVADSQASARFLTEGNQDRIPAELQASLADAHPLKRLGTPQDVATAAAFLASDQAAWITGVILDVADGAVLV